MLGRAARSLTAETDAIDADPLGSSKIAGYASLAKELDGYVALHNLLIEIVKNDPVCRHFMTVPGVGPIAAFSFRAGIDDFSFRQVTDRRHSQDRRGCPGDGCGSIGPPSGISSCVVPKI
jgi:transposase